MCFFLATLDQPIPSINCYELRVHGVHEWIMAQRHQTLDLRKYTASHAAINELQLGCIETNQGERVKPSSTMDARARCKSCKPVNLISASGKSLTAALPNRSSLSSRWRFANIDAGGDGKISLTLVNQILTDILQRDGALKHLKSSACHLFQSLLHPL